MIPREQELDRRQLNHTYVKFAILKLMRSSFGTLLFIAVLFGVGYWYVAVGASCRTPIVYHIGSVDPRFNMSTEAFQGAVEAAATLWEEQVGRDLFEYHASDGIPVHLVFDDRQKTANEEAELRDTLESTEGMNDTVRAQYEKLLTTYGAMKRAYEVRVSTYGRELEAYNTEVTSWNEKGGAPQDVYATLEATRVQLAQESQALSTLTEELNALVRKMNTLATQGNTLISDYNEVVERYNDRFGEGGEFTQGDYQGERINIYQFDTHDELVIVLAHELGHALALEHVEGEESIMYHLMEKQTLGKGVTDTDVAALSERCGTDGSLSGVVVASFWYLVGQW
jgi:hypothetical protein